MSRGNRRSGGTALGRPRSTRRNAARALLRRCDCVRGHAQPARFPTRCHVQVPPYIAEQWKAAIQRGAGGMDDDEGDGGASLGKITLVPLPEVRGGSALL